jgi:hypothetical protein
VAFFVAFGFAAHWGHDQWGPLSEWVAGGATVAAVVVALRQSFKGEQSRRIDHELSRRRECINALSDLWEGIGKITVRLPHFTGFLDELQYKFDPNAPLGDCCRALKLPTMPSLWMHTKHGVVRRRDDGVLDMMVPHMQRGNGGH